MLLPYTFSHYFVFVILLYWVLLFLDVNRKYFSNMGPHQPIAARPEIKFVCNTVQSKVMQQLNNIVKILLFCIPGRVTITFCLS